jgi:hypothetical protein
MRKGARSVLVAIRIADEGCMSMTLPQEIQKIKTVLEDMRKKGIILLAYLYGSYAGENQHGRSDNIAVYFTLFYNHENH